MKERFYPNCKVDENSGMLVCKPYIEANGEIIDKAKNELVFRVSENGEITPISIEGASTELIKRLKDVINNGDI